MIDFNLKDEIVSAENRIRPHIRETLLDYSLPLSKLAKANVYLKCENLQYTGSFKLRGALNKLLSLSESQISQGVVTASSGNHGAAVAFGLNKLKMPGIVFVPENTSSAKIENIQHYNIPLKFYGTDCMKTELYAVNYGKQHDMLYISPYNDIQVIAGQGTMGVEMMRQLHQIDIVLVPVGGGGLISGIAAWIKPISPKTTVIACLPANSPVMAESIKAGKIIEMETFPTLSDATAGGIEPDAITFELCKKFVDDAILVSEEDIKNAMVSLIKSHRLLVEGASGVALASLFKLDQKYHHKNIVVVLSGGNISVETLKTVLN